MSQLSDVTSAHTPRHQAHTPLFGKAAAREARASPIRGLPTRMADRKKRKKKGAAARKGRTSVTETQVPYFVLFGEVRGWRFRLGS